MNLKKKMNGNLKGFIDYSYDDDNITKNQRYLKEYVILQVGILKSNEAC